jgi:hypothetical protein
MNKVITVLHAAQKYAKAIIAGVGSVLVAVTSLSDELGVEIIPVEARSWLVFGLAALTAFTTWAVPNGVEEVPHDGE